MSCMAALRLNVHLSASLHCKRHFAGHILQLACTAQSCTGMLLLLSTRNICTTGGLKDTCCCCRYHDMGGEVEQLGKPGIAIYEAAMEMLGLKPEQLVAVGDSLQHDIAGELLGACLVQLATLPPITLHPGSPCRCSAAPQAVVCMTLPWV